MDKLNISAGAVKSAQTMQEYNGSNGIELPFPAPLFWWANGKPEYNGMHQVRSHGGWVTNRIAFEDALQHYGLDMPGCVEPVPFTARNGDELDLVGARYLIVAPIVKRYAFFAKDSQGNEFPMNNAPKGTRGRTKQNVVAYLGQDNGDGGFDVVMPIVLSVSGYQTSFMGKAVKKWEKAINPVIPKIVSDPNVRIPAHYFFMALGSFGGQAKYQSVGSHATSMITPIDCHIGNPQELPSNLAKLYIGNEPAEQIDGMIKSAEEWLNAWKEPQQVQQVQHGQQVTRMDGAAYMSQGGPGNFNGEQQYPEWLDDEDQLPF